MYKLNLTFGMLNAALAHGIFPPLTITENGQPLTKYIVGVGKPS
jgi:hypothetical protein